VKILKKNKTQTDCAVVAAYNAASWCNLKKTYKEVEKAARECGYGNHGLYVFQFSFLLKKLKIPAKHVKPRSLGDIESKLLLGKFLILLYTQTGQNVGHVVTAFTDHEGRIKLVNPENTLQTWNELAAEVYAHGMKNFFVYELPCRELIKP